MYWSGRAACVPKSECQLAAAPSATGDQLRNSYAGQVCVCVCVSVCVCLLLCVCVCPGTGASVHQWCSPCALACAQVCASACAIAHPLLPPPSLFPLSQNSRFLSRSLAQHTPPSDVPVDASASAPRLPLPGGRSDPAGCGCPASASNRAACTSRPSSMMPRCGTLQKRTATGERPVGPVSRTPAPPRCRRRQVPVHLT